MGVVGYVEITILVAVYNLAVAAVYLRTFRHVHMQYRFAVNGNVFNVQVKSRIDFLRAVKGRNEVFFKLIHNSRVNSGHGAVIGNSQQQITATAIEKGADTFVHIAIKGSTAGFELHLQPFASGY